MPTDRIRALLDRHPLVDGHNDLLWELRKQVGYDLDRADLAAGVPTTHTDLPRLRAGGVGAQFWSVWVPSDGSVDGVTGTLEQIDAAHAMIGRHADRLGAATTADEVEAVFASGRVASLLGMEGGHSIGCSLGTLRTMYALGARYMTLTHNDNVPWADAATDVRACGGLTRFGVEVVREMNRLGMLVDLSHVAPWTMDAALDATEAPVLFSHSSARALCDHPRDVPDGVLARVPGNGGVVMVTFVPYFLTEPAREWQQRLDAEEGRLREQGAPDREERLAAWRAANPIPVVTVADVADHVEHVRAVAGVDHVGIGGDFDGVPDLPVGLHDVSCYPALLGELADRGWSDGELAALAGGNVLRVLRDAEAVARDLRGRRGPSLATIAELDG
ncbi:MAG TPA: dipeptidase [Mycobacteriales bacterium]|jgi:membrane dipeptidase